MAKVIDINLTSTFLMTKSLIKKCLKLNLEKLSILHQLLVYRKMVQRITTSKAGIIAMSKSLAIEYAKKNININCISRGLLRQ